MKKNENLKRKNFFFFFARREKKNRGINYPVLEKSREVGLGSLSASPSSSAWFSSFGSGWVGLRSSSGFASSESDLCSISIGNVQRLRETERQR